MDITKDQIKHWLKSSGRDREWLGKQCGVSKRAVDNWLSRERPVPVAILTIIRRLMDDDRRAAEMQEESQNLVLEVDVPTFERWSRAALKHGEIVTEYAVRVIEEAAAADLANPVFLRAAEAPSKYPAKHGRQGAA